MAKARIGLWLIGAKGGVATTATVGLIALKEKWIGSTGLVTQLPQFQNLDLAPGTLLSSAGMKSVACPWGEESMRLAAEMRVASPELVARCRTELDRIDGRIRPGTLRNVGPTIAKLANLALPKGNRRDRSWPGSSMT